MTSKRKLRREIEDLQNCLSEETEGQSILRNALAKREAAHKTELTTLRGMLVTQAKEILEWVSKTPALTEDPDYHYHFVTDAGGGSLRYFECHFGDVELVSIYWWGVDADNVVMTDLKVGIDAFEFDSKVHRQLMETRPKLAVVVQPGVRVSVSLKSENGSSHIQMCACFRVKKPSKKPPLAESGE